MSTPAPPVTDTLQPLFDQLVAHAMAKVGGKARPWWASKRLLALFLSVGLLLLKAAFPDRVDDSLVASSQAVVLAYLGAESVRPSSRD